MREAKNSYNLKIMKKYIWNSLVATVKITKDQTEKAETFRTKWAKKNGFHKLRNAVDIVAYEAELELAKKSRNAYVFCEFNLKCKALQSLKCHMKQIAKVQNLHKRQIYDKHLKKRTFKLLVKL